MTKTFFYTIIFFEIFLLAKCDSPIQKKNISLDKDSITDTCCVENKMNKITDTSLKSEITCPKCGHRKMETMPTETCLIRYTCEKCSFVLFPKEQDCCIFCSYGTHKCPSKQEGWEKL